MVFQFEIIDKLRAVACSNVPRNDHHIADFKKEQQYKAANCSKPGTQILKRQDASWNWPGATFIKLSDATCFFLKNKSSSASQRDGILGSSSLR